MVIKTLELYAGFNLLLWIILVVMSTYSTLNQKSLSLQKGVEKLYSFKTYWLDELPGLGNMAKKFANNSRPKFMDQFFVKTYMYIPV